MATADSSLGSSIRLPEPDVWREHRMQGLCQKFGTEWTYWNAEEAQRFLAPESLRQRDHAFWLCLFAQAYCGHDIYGAINPDAWVVQACCALHGVDFALSVCLAFKDTLADDQHTASGWPGEQALLSLRTAVACATDEAHAQALQTASAWRQKSDRVGLICAHVFPHIIPWTEEAVNTASGRSEFELLATGTMAPATFLAGLEQSQWRLSSPVLLAAALLQAHLHGEAALNVVTVVAEKLLLSRDLKTASMGADLLQAMQTPGTFDAMLRLSAHKKVRDGFEKLAKAYPVAALCCLIRHALTSRTRTMEVWAATLSLKWPHALPAALAELDAPAQARFQAILLALNPQEAAPRDLPPVLREPPWQRAERPGHLPAIETTPITTPDTCAWPRNWSKEVYAEHLDRLSRGAPERDAHGFPAKLKLSDANARRLLAGQALQAGEIGEAYFGFDLIFQSPQAAWLALWNSCPPQALSLWDGPYGAATLIGALGTDAIPGLVRALSTHAGKGPQIALLLDTPLLVERMTQSLRHSRIHRDNAAQWILKFARTTLTRSVPQAFAAEHSLVRDNARYVIRWLAERGKRELVLDVASAYGSALHEATLALLDTDPLFILPGAMPALPAWFDPCVMRRPLLRTGGALPLASVEAIALMLIVSAPDAPYAGLEQVKQACTPGSLADWAWDLYEAWAAAGAPAKGLWAFHALGLLGDDETARRLMPRISEWAVSQGSRARAESALQLLATIGSDIALMLLNVQAIKGRHKRVQLRAAQMIEAVADQRGLTMDELGDRLAPTLDLDEPSAAELDFGPRRFFIGFDEALKPLVFDAAGKRLKDLPKPLKSDDAERARASAERFKQLKKDVRTIASLEITRLERAMVDRRRWTADAFERFFLKHPLIRHLAKRLVWASYADPAAPEAFRVAEDATLTDGSDAAWTLSDNATVGIAHVLELSASQQQRFGQLFADYEILQPFKQLARETYALAPEEAGQHTLSRFAGRDVATGAVIGLDKRGWERGEPQDGGMILDYWREQPKGQRVHIGICPGVFVGGGISEPRQTLENLWLERTDEDGRACPVTFSNLDALFVSEVLRDLDLLNPAASTEH